MGVRRERRMERRTKGLVSILMVEVGIRVCVASRWPIAASHGRRSHRAGSATWRARWWTCFGVEGVSVVDEHRKRDAD